MHSQWKQRRQSPDPTVLGFSMRRKRSYGKVLIMKFDPSKIEAKWQQKWEEAKVFEMDLEKAKKPYYTHVMWPYPSGDKLHVGHWFNFGPADSFARFMRMKGHNVFSPMGF